MLPIELNYQSRYLSRCLVYHDLAECSDSTVAGKDYATPLIPEYGAGPLQDYCRHRSGV
jgi:hypothetical protein